MGKQLDLRSRLSMFVGVLKKVRLNRDFPRAPHHNGFVLGMGRALVLIQSFHDFYNEGFTVLRLRDIKSMRSGKYERLWERMFRAEGILDAVGISYRVPLGSMRELLGYFASKRQNVIVECESRESWDLDFYIGRVLSVGSGSIEFQHFSALGRWEKKPYDIAIEDITRVQFESPYVTIFSKYVR